MKIGAFIDKRRKTNDGRYPVKIRISDRGKEALISVDIYAEIDEFDSASGMFLTTNRKTSLRNIQSNNLINACIARINDILLEARRDDVYISPSEIKGKYLIVPDAVKDAKIPSFYDFTDTFIGGCGERTAEIYKSTLNKIKAFSGDNLEFEDINHKWLLAFDSHMANEKMYTTHKDKTKIRLLKTGLSVNARSIHFRNIRSIFNTAIDDEVIPLNIYPFRRFKIKREETIKRAIKKDDIQALFSYSGSDVENWTIDVAKIIFYSIGINAKDLFYLDDIVDNLTYKRFKTSRIYNIPIEPELNVLLNRYAGESGLIFKEQMKLHTSFYRKINSNLKLICEKIGIPKVTTYSFRHTWATIASKLEIPKETIAAALGHGKRTVTDIYIDFDVRKIQEANRKVIDYVLEVD